MKKVTLSLLAVGLMVMVGCSGQKGAENSDTTDVQAAEQQYAYELTDTGVGPIQLGMDVDAVPVSVENLYDKVVKECDHMEFTEYCVMTFTQGQDTVMQAWCYDSNYDKVFNIASLNVYTKANVKMDAPKEGNYNFISDESLVPEMPE